jgi:two-component system chemotaxis response regulator CheB
MTKVFAIGASQGGVHALRDIAAGLPKDFPSPVLVVLHIGAERSSLPEILSDAGPLPATHAEHRELMEPGHIYVAPADRHLLLVGDRLELSHGPRENFVRPAVDPLFRSVAEYHGADAVGIVLTGRLNDGTSGLFEIKRRGGTAIVQEPKWAEAPSMPRSALANVAVDFSLPLPEIPRQMVRLANQKSKNISAHKGVHAMTEDQPLALPVAQTCPECGGAMLEENLGTLTRFRCHIGHIMTAEILAAAQLACLEGDIAAVLRFLNERANLCRRMAEKHLANGNAEASRLWLHAGDEAMEREKAAKALTQLDWSHPEEAPVKAKASV